MCFFFSSRRRHTRWPRDWSSDVCSSDLCGGILKPDVVFFGETARREVVGAAFDVLDGARTLLVLGSSLTVQSGLRFVRAAARAQQAVVIVNDGPTRADASATVRVHGRIEDVLAAWLRDLGA